MQYLIFFRNLIIMMGILFFLFSCNDRIDEENLYIYKEKTITQYVESVSEFSMFAKLIQKSQHSVQSNSTVASLLGSVGQYTVFVPTNDAIKTYLKSYYGTEYYSIDTISLQLANKIVLNCIIDLAKEGESAWTLYDLYGKYGVQAENTLNGRYINIQQTNNRFIFVNYDCLILSGEIECSNGTIFAVNKIIEPIPNRLSGLTVQTDNISIFNYLLELTSWSDSLIKYKDNNYVSTDNYAKYRLYGYTAFVEPDKIFCRYWNVPLPEKNPETGYVTNWKEIMQVVEKKCQEAYPMASSKDYTSINNAVNQFVSYHLLNTKVAYKDFVYTNNIIGYTPGCAEQGILPIDVHNYFQTMGYPYRLLKITKTGKENQLWLNRRSIYDNSFLGSYKEVVNIIKGLKVDSLNVGYNNSSSNGYYYPIDSILTYSKKVKNVVLNERIRYGICQVMPELYNNLIANSQKSNTYSGDFFEHLYFGKNENIVSVFRSSDYSIRMQDGTYCYFKNSDVALPLLTVPYSGNWEIRIQVPRIYYEKGKTMLQVQLGTNPSHPTGMSMISYPPIDYPMYSNFGNEIGWQEDWECDYGKDTLACLENDKKLQEHHLKAGPKSIGYFSWLAKDSKNLQLGYAWKYIGARSNTNYCRYIVYRGYLDENKQYYLQLKSLFNHNYPLLQSIYELVPENVYNNPDKAEDIW